MEISWPCPICDKDFSDDKEMEKHRETCRGKDSPKVPIATVTKAGEKTATPLKPQITLTYQYKGKCYGGHDLKTIIVEGKKNKVSVIAYCLTCDKQFEERTVEKL